MKVKDLIERLSKCDPEDVVVLSRDPEGNNYSPVSEICGDLKFKEDRRDGEIYGPDEADWVGEEEFNALPNAVALWPSY